MPKHSAVGSAIVSKTKKELVIFLDEGTICKIFLGSLEKLLEGKEKHITVLDHELNDKDLKNL